MYVDGGYKKGDEFHSAWSVVVVGVYVDGGQHILASAGGKILFDSSASSFLGESLPGNSFVSELYAQNAAK